MFHISLKTVDQFSWILLAGFESQEDSYRWIFKACRRHGVDFRTKSVGPAQMMGSDGMIFKDTGKSQQLSAKSFRCYNIVNKTE